MSYPLLHTTPRPAAAAAILMVLAIGLTGRAAPPTDDAFVWIEAESPTETDFPTDTWLSPADAREADALSGGRG